MRFVPVTFALVLAALAGPLLALANAPTPRALDPVLVIAPDAQALVIAAGGQLIGPKQAPLAALGVGDAGFVAALQRSRAWHVADGRWMAQICGVTI